jgi:hypothetical protein
MSISEAQKQALREHAQRLAQEMQPLTTAQRDFLRLVLVPTLEHRRGRVGGRRAS